MSVKRKVTLPVGRAAGWSGECNLHRLVDAEPPAFVVPLGMGSGRRTTPLLVEAPPSQREAEPLFVGLDEAPQKRCLLGVAARGSARGKPGKGVADEPIGTRVPGNAQGVAIVPLGGFRIVRVQVEVTEGVERARCAEVIVRADREIGGLAQHAPAAIEVAHGGRLLALEMQDAPETSG